MFLRNGEALGSVLHKDVPRAAPRKSQKAGKKAEPTPVPIESQDSAEDAPKS